MRRARKLTALTVLTAALAAWVSAASAEDAPPPPPGPPLERLFAPVREELKNQKLNPFFADMDLRAHFRTYYFNRTKPDESINESLATGGWLTLQSGWLLDTFAVGATFYGSGRLYGPEDRDGALLLKPSQESYYVPGEAWGAFRFEDLILAKVYRQQVDQGYINPQDNRMTPNTFEAVTVGGKIGWLEYFGGYLWNIKRRNEDEFVAMNVAAGAKGGHEGVITGGVRLTPLKGLRIDVNDQWGENMFNTLYAEADYLRQLDDDWKIRLSAQFTDQRAVGDARVASTAEDFWQTHVGGARLSVIFRELTLTTAFSITGRGNNIQSPWGSYIGYLSMIDQDFNRAGEQALLIGAAYDFARIASGLSAYFNLVWGVNAINPTTKKHVADQREYDFTVDYRPPFKVPSFLQGMWFRARAAVLDQEDAKTTGYQFRLIINWERNLI
jgi:hypothetical protein